MKKSLVTLITLAAVAGVYGQGTVIFNDHETSGSTVGGVFEIHIYGGTTPLTGDAANDLPAGGTTSYSGDTAIGSGGVDTGPTAFDNGTLYTVGLYAAPGDGVSAATMLGAGTADLIATTTFFNNANAGLFTAPGSETIPNLGSAANGYDATLMLACWYNGGTGMTYAQALAAGDPVGNDTPVNFNNILGNNTSSGTPANPPSLGNGGNALQSFAISATPEPSTIALGVIGASAFLMRLRRKQ
jgi:hypothetical protein